MQRDIERHYLFQIQANLEAVNLDQQAPELKKRCTELFEQRREEEVENNIGQGMNEACSQGLIATARMAFAATPEPVPISDEQYPTIRKFRKAGALISWNSIVESMNAWQVRRQEELLDDQKFDKYEDIGAKPGFEESKHSTFATRQSSAFVPALSQDNAPTHSKHACLMNRSTCGGLTQPQSTLESNLISQHTTGSPWHEANVATDKSTTPGVHVAVANATSISPHQSAKRVRNIEHEGLASEMLKIRSENEVKTSDAGARDSEFCSDDTGTLTRANGKKATGNLDIDWLAEAQVLLNEQVGALLLICSDMPHCSSTSGLA